MDVLDGVKLTVTRNMLKWAVGKQITCPRCQDILDAKRAVMCERDNQGGTIIQCARCWDAHHEPGEVTDGRKLWPPRVHSPKPGKTAMSRTTWRSTYTAFIKGLKAQGCVFCPTCYAYLYPTHTHTRRTK